MRKVYLRALFILSISSLLLGCGQSRTPCKYIVTEKFRGWVTIETEVPDAPSIPQEQGFLIYRIPNTGKLRTSSESESGVARDQYYRETPNSLRRLLDLPGDPSQSEIHGGSIGSETRSDQNGTVIYTSHPTQKFFVGSEAELQMWYQKSTQ